MGNPGDRARSTAIGDGAPACSTTSCTSGGWSGIGSAERPVAARRGGRGCGPSSRASVLTPAGDRLDVQLSGDLAEIVAFSGGTASNKNGAASGGGGAVVYLDAGTRSHLYRTRLRTRPRR